MFSILINNHDVMMFVLRVVVGFIFIWHGMPKFRKPEAMAQGLGWSVWMVRLLGAVEILAGLGIIFGVFLQWSAFILALTMIGAIYHKIFKWKTPFWSQTGTGWEFDLLLLACLLLIIAHGPEEFSLMNF